MALGVPWWQRRGEREERKRKEQRLARSLGTVIIRELRTLEKRIRTEIERKERARDGEIMRVQVRLIPQLLWDKAGEIHLLGSPGDKALQAIYEVFQGRVYAPKFVQDARDRAVSPEDRTQYICHMTKALEHCRVAIAGVHSLLTNVD